MAAQRTPGKGKRKGKRPTDRGWAGLTWSDLEKWAGSRSVARGRSYQRGGRVVGLAVTDDGELLATVVGGDRYAVRVSRKGGRRSASLESTCTCPVGHDGCKHAVAVVAEYLEALAKRRKVAVAAEDDPRWEELETASAGIDDEDDESWEDDEEDERPPAPGRRVIKKTGRRGKAAVNWDEKIEREVRAKSREELADLVWSLVKRFPELYQEFRERIALREGDVDRLVEEARAEIGKVISEPSWGRGWSGGGQTPDYSRIQHRLVRLLELGHADEVVALGRELIEEGLREVGESDEEARSARALGRCLPVVFEAVGRSSLSGPERLLFAIDAELTDDYGLVEEASGAVLDADFPPADWSVVADALIGRLRAMSVGVSSAGGDFNRKYHRDQVANWAAHALYSAGRDAEVQALYESEARVTGSYERLVKFLMEEQRFEDAERWVREGIAAAMPTYSGPTTGLVDILRELAEKRKQWDVVAAHAAGDFFDRPARSTFDELIKAARKAKLEEPVRTAALKFLETGARPYQIPAPPAESPPTTFRASAKRQAATTVRTPARREATPQPSAQVKIHPSWPLPVPDYLIPILAQRGRYAPEDRPHLDVLLDMAIAAKQPDEVLRWYEKLRGTRGYRSQYEADRVAEAVAASHPERALAIYRDALEA